MQRHFLYPGFNDTGLPQYTLVENTKNKGLPHSNGLFSWARQVDPLIYKFFSLARIYLDESNQQGIINLIKHIISLKGCGTHSETVMDHVMLEVEAVLSLSKSNHDDAIASANMLCRAATTPHFEYWQACNLVSLLSAISAVRKCHDEYMGIVEYIAERFCHSEFSGRWMASFAGDSPLFASIIEAGYRLVFNRTSELLKLCIHGNHAEAAMGLLEYAEKTRNDQSHRGCR